MDQQANLTDVLKKLQGILGAPNIALSEHFAPPSGQNEDFPILPQHMPKLEIPNIDHPLPSLIKDFTGRQHDETHSPLNRLSSHLVVSILPYLNRASLSPNYYGFVTGGATPAALLGDFLASIFDQSVCVHLPRETLATTLEVTTLNMLVQLFRLPEPEWSIGKKESMAGGIFTTGATASNVLGLALGREYVIRKALERRSQDPHSAPIETSSMSCGEYGLAELMVEAGVKKIQILSTLPHSSIVKAAGIVGIGRRNVVSLSTADDPLQIDFNLLHAEASRRDVVNILTVSAGEVNTGRFATNSLEQWTRLRRICDEHGIWIHVDGAFGLFGRLFPEDDDEYKRITQGVQGIELADSITGDCHKLLNVPYDCGVFFTRHKSLLEDVFCNGNAAYLTSGAAANAGYDDGYGAIQSPMNIGIENSRRFRALPAYATLMAYGRDGYLDMLKRQIGLARRVTKWLLHDERFEVLPSSRGAGTTEEEMLAKTFMVVLFRVRDDEAMKTFVKRVNDTGKMYITGTVWDGKAAARIAVSNWQADVKRDGQLIETVLDAVIAGRG